MWNCDYSNNSKGILFILVSEKSNYFQKIAP